MSQKSKNFEAEIWGRLKDHQHIFLATEENGQPRVRPVTLINFEKLYVLTGTDSTKVKQIRENPKMEFCLPFEEKGHHGYIRASGLAKIVKDKETKVKLANHCDFFCEHWESPDDTNYTLFELKLNEIEYLGPNESITRKVKL